jgi:hypothetical protein
VGLQILRLSTIALMLALSGTAISISQAHAAGWTIDPDG